MKTFLPKPSLIERSWYVIDAENQVLGKVATKAAVILRGKHKPLFTPQVDTGDGVIIINAAKVVLTGNKALQKKYFRYSGYPGHVKAITAEEALLKKPALILEKAIAGMIPRTRHAKNILQRLKIYAAAEHPHAAQNPIPLELS